MADSTPPCRPPTHPDSPTGGPRHQAFSGTLRRTPRAFKHVRNSLSFQEALEILPQTLLTDSEGCYFCLVLGFFLRALEFISTYPPPTFMGLSEGRWDRVCEAFRSREEYFCSIPSFIYFCIFIHSTNIYWVPVMCHDAGHQEQQGPASTDGHCNWASG